MKGACGASTLAASLAFQWKRFEAKRVLLADMDASTGTISFLLKLKSTYSFIDALARAESLDADLWRGIVSQSGGIDVLLSPEHTNSSPPNCLTPPSFCVSAGRCTTTSQSTWLRLMASGTLS